MLLSRRAIFPVAKEVTFYAFSKGGFSKWVQERAAADGVVLVGVDEMFR